MTESPRADLSKVPEEIASMFDSVASRYDAMDTLMTGGMNNVWMTALRKAVAPHPGERILDLAAGTGTSSASLAKGGAEVVACDLSEGMIEVGRERHPEIEFVHGNAMDLDFEDGSFDAVTISWGLRNIPDPQLALREMARVRHAGDRAPGLHERRRLRLPGRVDSRMAGPGGARPHDRRQRLERGRVPQPHRRHRMHAPCGQAAAVKRERRGRGNASRLRGFSGVSADCEVVARGPTLGPVSES